MPPRAERGGRRSWPATAAPALVAAGILIAAWQLVADHDRYVLPTPHAVGSQLWHHPGVYVGDGLTTIGEALGGLAIGFAAACVLAVAMSQVRVVARAVLPLAVLANVTPVVAVAPALVVAFGFGAAPKLVVTALICFFPVLVNAIAGLDSADPAILDVLEVLHASRLEVLLRVRLPASLPQLFVALRIVLPLSVIGAVVSEFVTQGSTSGLGTVIAQAAANSALDQVYAAVVCLGAIGVVLTGVVVAVERRVIAWRGP